MFQPPRVEWSVDLLKVWIVVSESSVFSIHCHCIHSLSNAVLYSPFWDWNWLVMRFEIAPNNSELSNILCKWSSQFLSMKLIVNWKCAPKNQIIQTLHSIFPFATGLKSSHGLMMHFIGSAILYYVRLANGPARGSKEIYLNLPWFTLISII